MFVSIVSNDLCQILLVLYCPIFISHILKGFATTSAQIIFSLLDYFHLWIQTAKQIRFKLNEQNCPGMNFLICIFSFVIIDKEGQSPCLTCLIQHHPYPYLFISWPNLLYLFLICLTMPYHTLPQHTITYHKIPYYNIPYLHFPKRLALACFNLYPLTLAINFDLSKKINVFSYLEIDQEKPFHSS